MKELKWDHSMSVNILSLDQEHNRLISLINNLLVQIANREVATLNMVLFELTTYCKEHFNHEEKLFKLFNYKDIDIHIQLHKEFVGKIEEFNKKINNLSEGMPVNDADKMQFVKTAELKKEENLVIASNMVRFLFDWLINHILKEDKKYSDLFNEHGVI